jgi:hypothetical protein
VLLRYSASEELGALTESRGKAKHVTYILLPLPSDNIASIAPQSHYKYFLEVHKSKVLFVISTGVQERNRLKRRVELSLGAIWRKSADQQSDELRMAFSFLERRLWCVEPRFHKAPEISMSRGCSSNAQ